MNHHGAVTLRPVCPDDLLIFFLHQADPEAAAQAAFPTRSQPAFEQHWQRVLQNHHIIKRTILADDAVAGHISSFPHQGARHVGYWIGRPFWGQRIATRALALFLEIDRSRPLHALVAAHNTPSLRLLHAAGFRLHARQMMHLNPELPPHAECHLILPSPHAPPHTPLQD